MFCQINKFDAMTEKLHEVKLDDGSVTKFTIYTTDVHSEMPVVILFPAMGTPASYYEPFAKALAQKRITAITADLRGIGHSSIRPGAKSDFGFREMIELDYKGVIEKINSLFPSKKKYILGHSLGGILGSLFLSRFPGMIDGIILIASVNIHYKGWNGFSKWQILLATQLFGVLASVMGYFPGHRVGFGGRGAKGVIKDWSRTARTGRYVIDNTAHDYESKLKEVTTPILAVSFRSDNLAPKRAVENLLAKFRAASKITHRHLDKISATGKKYSHYNWVKNPDEVAGLVSEWLFSPVR